MQTFSALAPNRTVVALVLALCALTVKTRGEDRVDIRVHDLGTAHFLMTAAINDRGVIAGWASGQPAFVLDTRTGAMVTLPYFEPRSINNRGEVVGIYDAPRSSGGAQGTFWSAREGLRRLPDFVSSGINKQGDMAGNCMAGIDVYGPPCVFFAGRNGGHGTLHPIDVGAGVSALASDINDRGEVVGTIYYETGASRAFIWSARKGLRLLEPSPLSQNSTALAINNHGIVAGNVSDQEGTFATEWTRSGAIIAQLGTTSWALDVNDQGIGIVNGLNEATGRPESKVWIPDIGVLDLPLPSNWAGHPWAYEINNREQIVGTMFPFDDGVDPESHVVIWDVRIRGRHAGHK